MADVDVSATVEGVTGGVRLRVKVVPGASRSRVAGVLGDRLKVLVAAPPEGGKANKAICSLLAEVFRLPASQVHIVSGQSQPRKTIEIAGVTTCDVVEMMRAHLVS